MELTLRKSGTSIARSEHALVAAARRGDDRAFEELYANYRQRIFAFIASKVRDHGRAEDIAQEVFISALRRLRASDQPISFKPWIYEIAKNACIDEFRRGSRSREVPLEPDENIGAGERPMMSLVPSPPAAIENKQRLDDLRGAFGGLSESHHQLLVLREFEGLTYDEIGDRLGMTRQMVESSLFRARRKLTAEYDELASGRRCEQIQTAIESGAAQSITSLGVRERRRFGRHLAHCQTCRHTARLAGVDEALLKPRSIAAKIAALFPFPLLRWPWGGGRGKGGAAAARSGSHHATAAGAAARIAQPASSLSLGPAAAAVAALAIAGAGTGLVVGLEHHHPSSRPSSAVLAAESVQMSSHQRTVASAAPVRSPANEAAAKRANMAAALSLGTGAGGLGFPGTASGSPAVKAARHLPGGTKRTSSGSGTGRKAAGPASSVISPVSNADGSIRSTLSGVTSTVRQTVSGVTKTVGSTLAGARGTVGSTVSGVNNTLGSAVSGVGHTVGQVTSPAASGSAGGNGGSAAGNVGSTVGSVASKVDKTVGSITGAVSSSSSPTSGASPVAHSVTAPVKSVASALLSK